MSHILTGSNANGKSQLQNSFNSLLQNGVQTIINMTGHQVKNMKDGSDEQDAVTLFQLNTVGPSPGVNNIRSLTDPNVNFIITGSVAGLDGQLAANNVKIVDFNQAKLADIAIGVNAFDAACLSNTICDFLVPSTNLSMNLNKIVSLQKGVNANDAASLSNTICDFLVPSSNLNMNSNKITSLQKGVNANDAASLSNTICDFLVPSSNLNMNSNRIVSTSDPVGQQDVVTLAYLQGHTLPQNETLNQIQVSNPAALDMTTYSVSSSFVPNSANILTNKTYVDAQIAGAGFLPSNSTLNSIATTNPTSGDVSLNSHKLLLVSNATVGTDGVNLSQLTGGYVPLTDSLQTIYTRVPSNLNIGSNTFTSSHSAVSGNELLNQTAGDARYYQSTVPLQSITLATGSLNLNTNQITGVVDPTTAQMAATKSYVDNNSLPSTSTLQTIYTAHNSDLNVGANIFSSSHAAASGNEILNQTAGDARYYQSTVPLQSITLATGSLNLNTHQIIGLVDPTTAQMAASKNYVDTTTLSSTKTLQQIYTANPSDLNVGANILSTSNVPASVNQVTNKAYVDNNFYANTTPLQSISVPTGNVSLNSQKITNLATPTVSTDAVNKSYADGAFMSKIDSLATIASNNASVASITASSQKITNLGAATLTGDAVQYGQLTRIQDVFTTPNSSVTTTSTAINKIVPATGSENLTNGTTTFKTTFSSNNVLINTNSAAHDLYLQSGASNKNQINLKQSNNTVELISNFGNNQGIIIGDDVTGLLNFPDNITSWNSNGDLAICGLKNSGTTSAIFGVCEASSQQFSVYNVRNGALQNSFAINISGTYPRLIGLKAPSIQVITSSQTVTISDYNFVKITACAGGGGSGSSNVNQVQTGGGGSGSAGIKYYNLTGTNDSIVIVIGAGGSATLGNVASDGNNGGNTTVAINGGTTMTCNGGTGGGGNPTNGTYYSAKASHGQGGAISTNFDLNLTGGNGQGQTYTATINVQTGCPIGGFTPLGLGSPQGGNFYYQNGTAFGSNIITASGYGYGGTGVYNSLTSLAGGSGLVLLEFS